MGIQPIVLDGFLFMMDYVFLCAELLAWSAIFSPMFYFVYLWMNDTMPAREARKTDCVLSEDRDE